MSKLFTVTLLSAALSINLMGCTTNISPDVTQANSANSVQTAIPGTIVSEHAVTVKGDNMIGTLSGAALGGVGASAIGGSSRAHIMTGIAGALLGGAAGNAIEDKITTQKGIEYVVRLDNAASNTTTINRVGRHAARTTITSNNNGNRYVNVIQGQGAEQLSVGQRVMVAGVGSKHVTIISTIE